MEKTLGLWFELAVELARRIRRLNLPIKTIQDLMKNKNHPFWTAFEELKVILIAPSLTPSKYVQLPAVVQEVSFGKQMKGWKTFYKKFFNIKIDTAGMHIPEHVPGFDYLIVVLKGLSLNRVYDVSRLSYLKNNTWDMEKEMQVSERGEIRATYAIWVRNEPEIEEEFLGISAEDIRNPENTENLFERLLHGLKYWSETKKQLDLSTTTLCASSFYHSGRVPIVSSIHHTGFLEISGCSRNYNEKNFGVRRVIR